MFSSLSWYIYFSIYTLASFYKVSKPKLHLDFDRKYSKHILQILKQKLQSIFISIVCEFMVLSTLPPTYSRTRWLIYLWALPTVHVGIIVPTIPLRINTLEIEYMTKCIMKQQTLEWWQTIRTASFDFSLSYFQIQLEISSHESWG